MTHRIHSLLTVLVALAALLALLAPEPAAARASNGEWSVIPTSSGSDGGARTSFVFDAEPGATISDSVTVQNLTDRDKTFRIFAADAFNTPSEGAFAVRGPEFPPTDAGSWIRLATAQWTVPAGMQAAIPFSVTIPANAAPGDRAAGISVLETDTTTSTGNDGVELKVQRAVAAPVFLRIAGELRESVRISDLRADYNAPLIPGLQKGRTKVTFTVVNDGNVRVSAETVTRVAALFGLGDVRIGERSIPHLLPGNSAEITLLADSGPWLGRGTARVHLTADSFDLTRSASFFAIPWFLVLVALVLAAAVVLARRRRRSVAVGPVPPGVEG